jgi:hypothetical protein
MSLLTRLMLRLAAQQAGSSAQALGAACAAVVPAAPRLLPWLCACGGSPSIPSSSGAGVLSTSRAQACSPPRGAAAIHSTAAAAAAAAALGASAPPDEQQHQPQPQQQQPAQPTLRNLRNKANLEYSRRRAAWRREVGALRRQWLDEHRTKQAAAVAATALGSEERAALETLRASQRHRDRGQERLLREIRDAERQLEAVRSPEGTKGGRQGGGRQRGRPRSLQQKGRPSVAAGRLSGRPSGAGGRQ